MSDMKGVSEEERLKARIAHTRAELGETVQALAAKADVPARVKRRGAELTHEAQVKVHDAQVKVKQAPPSWWIAGGGAIAAIVALIVFLRGRS